MPTTISRRQYGEEDEDAEIDDHVAHQFMEQDQQHYT